MTNLKEITSAELDFGDTNAVTDEQLKNVRVKLDTSVAGSPTGSITLEFWPETAPITVRNFVRYAAEGHYNGLKFHRIIPGFMIQGGCPLGTGTGSGEYGNIKGEFSSDKQYSHQRGVLSMARSADPNSASCQFFICHGDASFLDGQYAAFGKLTDGDDALEAIATAQTKPGGEGSSPAQPCVIQKMTVFMEG